MSRLSHLVRPATLAVALSLAGLSTIAHADATQDEIQLLKEQLRMLTEKIDQLSKKQDRTEQVVTETQSTVQAAAKDAQEAKSSNFFSKTDEPGLNFKTPGGGFSIYGQFDVSADGVDNGLTTVHGANATPGLNGSGPFGNNGFLAALSTNSTNIGLRGFQNIGGLPDAQFIWQLQTNLALTATAGVRETNSQQSNVVNGAMTTGTSYVGVDIGGIGKIKAGKTMAPYFLSTDAIFNPFQGQLGSMDVVMGNTGGDNRVEFGTILEHAFWYESPNMNGWKVAALFAPGQNRATDSSAIPQGSSDCAGGNIPGSGGLTAAAAPVIGCNDGGFSNAFSSSITYENKSWYVVGAYELHKRVNRSSDLGPYNYTNGNVVIDSQYAAIQADTADEFAYKVGAMYRIESTGTRIGGIYERMRRNVPQLIAYQNERSRNGFWLTVQQDLTPKDTVNFGWAHAARAQGDPGQHNTGGNGAASGTLAGGLNVDNSANMFTINFVHKFDQNLSVYANIAETVNSTFAHYDLGAGGHGIKTDCHDAGGLIPASGGESSSPNCWAGTTIQGVTVGMRYKF